MENEKDGVAFVLLKYFLGQMLSFGSIVYLQSNGKEPLKIKGIEEISKKTGIPQDKILECLRLAFRELFEDPKKEFKEAKERGRRQIVAVLTKIVKLKDRQF